MVSPVIPGAGGNTSVMPGSGGDLNTIIANALANLGNGGSTKGRQAVTYQDGSKGSFDPNTGTYYDANGAIVPDPQGKGALTFDQQYALATAPRSSSSTSYGVSDIGPNALANDAANRAATAQQEAAKLSAQLANYAAQIAQTEQQIAQAQQLYNFNVSKQGFADATSNATLANQAAQGVATQQAQIATLGIQMAQLQESHAAAQAQLNQTVALANASAQQAAAQFNSQMKFNVEQGNVQANQQKQTLLNTINQTVASEAANPGDRGQYAAYVLANQNKGFGQGDAGLANGANFLTPASLAPLQGSLEQKNQVAAQPDNPYTFTPVQAAQATAPVLPALDLSQVKMPTVQNFVGNVPAPNYGATGSTALQNLVNGVVPTSQNSTDFENRPTNPAETVAYQQAKGLPQWVIGSGLTQKADGGMVKGAYISGEAGPELNIPMGKGHALVINAEQMAKMKPAMVKQLKKMADGGVFSNGTVFPLGQGQDQTLARNFLSQATAAARAGTPFANGVLPTPVFASSPAFNPIVTQLLDSLNAQARGLPPGEYTRQAALLAPQGLNNVGAIGRTA